MQHLEVSCAVQRFFKSLGFKGLGQLGCYAITYNILCNPQSLFLPQLIDAVSSSYINNNNNTNIYLELEIYATEKWALVSVFPLLLFRLILVSKATGEKKKSKTHVHESDGIGKLFCRF